jgi:hypothetical protein
VRALLAIERAAKTGKPQRVDTPAMSIDELGMKTDLRSRVRCRIVDDSAAVWTPGAFAHLGSRDAVDKNIRGKWIGKPAADILIFLRKHLSGPTILGEPPDLGHGNVRFFRCHNSD